jgi:DNA-binding NtrC family response regulator
VSGHVLVVDDEIGIRELLSEILTEEGYDVHLAENAAAARTFRSQRRPDLVLLDIWMPDTDGVTLLKEWASNGLLTMPVVMMSGHGTIDTAVEATRMGAVDYLEKPIALAKLLSAVDKAIKKSEAPRRVPSMELNALGRSPVIQELKRRLAQIAGHTTPVMLTGEAGSGFEQCARYLHQPGTPWVELRDLSQLVSAPGELAGKIEHGTLFVPDQLELNKLEQKGLSLVLDRLDNTRARVVFACTRSPETLVSTGDFDARLLYRISGVRLRLPPLREHREDVPEIASLMLAQLIEARECPSRRLSTGAQNQLRQFDWPGNLPQLRNTVKTLALLTLGEEIESEDVHKALVPLKQALNPGLSNSSISFDVPLREARDAFERLYFEHLIQKEGGSMTRVAERAGLERTHLYRKLKQLNIRHGKRLEEEL